MTDPLDLTIPGRDQPSFELDSMRGLVIPTPEVEVAPIWTTKAELDEGKQLIGRIELDIAKRFSK
jgi:hypothetical protein